MSRWWRSAATIPPVHRVAQACASRRDASLAIQYPGCVGFRSPGPILHGPGADRSSLGFMPPDFEQRISPETGTFLRPPQPIPHRQVVDHSGLILLWWLKTQLERIASQVMRAGDWTCQAHFGIAQP